MLQILFKGVQPDILKPRGPTETIVLKYQLEIIDITISEVLKSFHTKSP